MAQLVHKNEVDPNIHEPKGISTAALGAVETATGSGSSEWTVPPSIDPSAIAIPIGTTIQFAGSVEPAKWFFCFGQELSRATYSDLFSVVGTTYGAGDTTTTFNLPDCRGRVLAGKDDMGGSAASRLVSQISGDSLGATAGVQNYMLLDSEVPTLEGTTDTTGSHTHTVTNGSNVARNSGSGGSAGGITMGALTTSTLSVVDAPDHTHSLTVNSTTSNAEHINVQPSLVFNTIIYHGVL